MSWKEKITKGMELIKEGCKETQDCSGCPFTIMCCGEHTEEPCFWIKDEEGNLKVIY